jgi:hypothetical protein
VRFGRLVRFLACSISLASAIGSPSELSACQCASKPSVEDSLAQGAEIFLGQVVNLWPVLLQTSEQAHIGQVATFHVQASWSDSVQGRAEVVSGLSNCDFVFRHGRTYLVYARKSALARGLSASVCSRTSEYGPANRDLDKLGAPVSEAQAAPVRSERYLHRFARRVATAWIFAKGTARHRWASLSVTTGGVVTQHVVYLILFILPLGSVMAARRLGPRKLFLILAMLCFVGLLGFVTWGYFLVGSFDSYGVFS